MRFALCLASLTLAASAQAELRVPASTAYIDPDANGARVSKTGISNWTNPSMAVSWFGQFKTAGKVSATLAIKLPKDTSAEYTLAVEGQSRNAKATGTGEFANVSFGEFQIRKPGYVKFTLGSAKPAGEIDALLLDGPALEGVHFNTDPRRNAASVHLKFPTPKDEQVVAFYNEMTGVDEPVATYYMACGFSRGYFGMQVNSKTERRIIFSVWDAGSGQSADNRDTVAAENHTQLLAKGEGVHASVFGNEGTGGHSHLKYPWKTGEKQKFVVTAKPEGTNTDYTGYWFHPEEKQWKLIASFRAPKDGKALRGLYSFSENFNGNNGHLRRKALFGPQWIQLASGEWREILEASFSHDGTGKTARLDRLMGVENGMFFLQHGGFVDGFTQYGEKFTRPASGKRPEFTPPKP